MKTALIVVFALICSFSHAQRVEIENGSVTVYSDSLSIEQSFKFTDDLLPWQFRYYDRYVVHNGVTYYRAGLRFLRKQRIYIVDLKTGNISYDKARDIKGA